MRKIRSSSLSMAFPFCLALAAFLLLVGPALRKPVFSTCFFVLAAALFMPTKLLAAGHGHNPNTIESALAALKAGNGRFAAGSPAHPHQDKALLDRLAKEGQTPLAAVLACSDSRAAVEELFDMGFGDLFVVRAAGAVPGVDQVGSLEYAVAHLGVPVILVLGHTNCGAVSAAVAEAKEPGALGELLAKLSPVAAAVKDLPDSKRLKTAIELSAIVFREQLPLASPVLAEAVKEGRLAIVSGIYDIATGQVAIDEGRRAGASGSAGGE
ncbi:MAG: carbonic anhydrase [Deltaproteobacteria bacterium]|jgi:carbonic anhydrase|nr:carbonic anhydrase [Deltaproteobacteria bacterium]